MTSDCAPSLANGSNLGSFERRWTIDDVVKVQLGCGMAARRIGSLSMPAAAECEARVGRRMAELPSEALLRRPEILFATASRPL
jgi:hypothetical protein